MTSARFRPAVADRPLVGPRKFQSVVVLHHTLGWKLIDDQIDLTSISRISLVTRFVVYSDRGQRLSKHARADVYTHPPPLSTFLPFLTSLRINRTSRFFPPLLFFKKRLRGFLFPLLFEWRLLNEERERWNFIGSAKTLSLDGKCSGKFNHRPTKIAISSKCRVYMYMYVRAQIRTMSVGWFSAKEKQPWRKSVAQTVAPSRPFASRLWNEKERIVECFPIVVDEGGKNTRSSKEVRVPETDD